MPAFGKEGCRGVCQSFPSLERNLEAYDGVVVVVASCCCFVENRGHVLTLLSLVAFCRSLVWLWSCGWEVSAFQL